MRRIAAIFAALFLISCNGGGPESQVFHQTIVPEGQQALQLSGIRNGSNWRVELNARNVQDLYQFAGSISFPANQYEIVLVESGGGLGGPGESLFAGGPTDSGRVDLAYTKRYAGSGEFGDVRLASIKVVPLAEFNIRDFQLDVSEGAIAVHDSNRAELEITVAGGAL